VTGKPVSIGGTEGRRESTGRGVVYLIERAMNMLKIDPEKCTAIVRDLQRGLGRGAFTRLQERRENRRISDAYAAIYNQTGSYSGGRQHVLKKGSLRAFHEADHVSPKELLTMPCDVLAPCAVDRVINETTP